ncbi:MAG: sigma-70 family RNA polymerase sigma factor [Thermoanaerobaculia bacterium]|nr:sigma-70 family RNA polymerase sigma factor [Thermoanaerobaculia bacterium]
MRANVSDFDPPAKAPADAGAVTRLLAAARGGDSAAPGKLFEIVYADLRALAGRHVRGARNAGPSATSLVHEAFLRIAKRGDLPYADRTHFFAVASRAMRQIVIDDARGRKASKRGGGQTDVDLEAIQVAAPAASAPVEDLLALDDALSRLEREAPRLAQTVEWHFFGGLTFSEIAEATDVSRRTVQRDWRAARALLHLELATSEG